MDKAEAAGIRRADWRFLLPVGRSGHVLDVTDQRLARSLPHAAIDRGAPYDVVVGTDPQPRQLEHAFASLRPGGVCYFEWRGRLRPSAGSVRRRLAAAGFDAVRLYWSWPPEIPSVWVPLEAPAAARWVLRRRHDALAARAWRAAEAARLVRPRCAVAARPPFAESAGPVGVPLDHLGSGSLWALLAPGSAPLNKVLAFVGFAGVDDPALVLKMPRTTAAVAALEREAAALRALDSGASPGGVPRLLFEHREAGSLRAIAESPHQGRPLFELLDRRRHFELVRLATDWLVQLARMRPGPADLRPTVAELTAETAVKAAPADRELIVDAGRLASPADALPAVLEQRDFSPWNVHLGHDGGLVVFDWESAEQAGFPALDLVYLLAYCGFFLDRALPSGRARESYRATFERGVAAESLTRYCRALAIDPDLLPALRALTWLVHLRSALGRDPAGADTALFLDLLREEARVPRADAAAR